MLKNIIINGTEIIYKEFNGVPVITTDDMFAIGSLNVPKRTAIRDKFNKSKSRFTEDVDYYITTQRTLKELEHRSSGLRGNPSTFAYLYTINGLKIFISLFKNKVNSKVTDELLAHYFNSEAQESEDTKEIVTIPEKFDIESKEFDIEPMPIKNNSAIINDKKDSLRSVDIAPDFFQKQLEFLQNESSKNEEFRNTMMQSFQMLAQVINNQSKIIAKFTQVGWQGTEQNVTKKAGFLEWKDNIYDIIGDRDSNAVLSATYKYMTKNYGVVWSQVQKEYIQANEKRAYSNLELVYWMENTQPSYKNLMIGCLNTILNDKGNL